MFTDWKLKVTSLKVKERDKPHDFSNIAAVPAKCSGLSSGPMMLNPNQDCISYKRIE